jgi:hypothetical protein|tara:strand:+ start:1100 stop:1393 length:294 start_codon:yes stop_codon:yes gene_type:complete
MQREANAAAQAQAQKMIEANQKQMEKMMAKIPDPPKPGQDVMYEPTQVKSSYDDTNQGIKTAKSIRGRRKSNMSKLRIKLNPNVNMPGASGGSTNLG